MPRLITKSGTEHATASGAVWLRHLNASLLLLSCPATPDPMRHTHRVNACRRLVRRVVLTDSVVSSIRLRKPGSSTLLLLRANPRRRLAACHEPCFALVLRLSGKRAQEREAVSAPSRGPGLTTPAHHPVNSALIPSVSSSHTQKTHSASCPGLAARCRHEAVSACRRFPDLKNPPATLVSPAYRPPKGNGAVRSRMQSSQVPVAPACHCAVIV